MRDVVGKRRAVAEQWTTVGGNAIEAGLARDFAWGLAILQTMDDGFRRIAGAGQQFIASGSEAVEQGIARILAAVDVIDRRQAARKGRCDRSANARGVERDRADEFGAGNDLARVICDELVGCANSIAGPMRDGDGSIERMLGGRSRRVTGVRGHLRGSFRCSFGGSSCRLGGVLGGLSSGSGCRGCGVSNGLCGSGCGIRRVLECIADCVDGIIEPTHDSPLFG